MPTSVPGPPLLRMQYTIEKEPSVLNRSTFAGAHAVIPLSRGASVQRSVRCTHGLAVRLSSTSTPLHVVHAKHARPIERMRLIMGTPPGRRLQRERLLPH